MAGSVHTSVLVREVLESLRAKEGGAFLDCTYGGGGHTRAILEAHQENRVTALDRDRRALQRGARDVEAYSPRLKLFHGAFSELGVVVEGETFNGVLADLGLSTDQIREERGFSFSDSRCLDMRMNEDEPVSAHDVVNQYSEQELFVVLKEGGVGSEARAIAREIVRSRPLETSKDLAAVINRVSHGKRTTNPATVTFQAIRMKVNQELEEIKSLMAAAPSLMKEHGRLSVITFHSLEDKAVTRMLRIWEGSENFPALWPGHHSRKTLGKVITKKPITPPEEEVVANPSARSAKLRVFEFH